MTLLFMFFSLVPVLFLVDATSQPVQPPSNNPFKNIANSLSSVEKSNLKALADSKTYAPIKQMLDQRFATLPQQTQADITSYAENAATPAVTQQMNTDLTPDEQAILNAYINATAFEKIYAFWEAKIIAVSVPDLVAISTYYIDKQVAEDNDRNFLSKFFEKVKNFFKSEDKKTCNSATNDLSPLLNLTSNERQQLDGFIQSGNITAIGNFFDQKVRTLPQNVQDRINQVLKDNTPPPALVRINNSLNSTTEHADLIAQWKITGNNTAIEAYWKRKLEALSDTDQTAIKNYFDGINNTIGACFTPSPFPTTSTLPSGSGAGFIFSAGNTSTSATSSTMSSTSSSFHANNFGVNNGNNNSSGFNGNSNNNGFNGNNNNNGFNGNNNGFNGNNNNSQFSGNNNNPSSSNGTSH